jgi:hypothetical protein
VCRFDASGASVPALLIASSAWAPVRACGKVLGLQVHWDQAEQIAYLGGKAFPGQVSLIDGTAYAQVRKLAAFSALNVRVDDAAKVIHIRR